MAGTQAQASTVDPSKWLATLRVWVPTEPLEVLVALINSLIEASGPARVEGLDTLIAHTEGTTRTGREKFERLRQWCDKMRADPLYWPQRFVRRRAVSILIKAILNQTSRPLDRFEVERKFRKFRDVPPSGLSQELKEMAKRGEIDRIAVGLYWRKGTAGKPYETPSQQLYRLTHDAPGHRMRNAELAVAMGISRKDFESRLSHMRKRWCDPPLFEPPTGDGVAVVSAESLAVLKRDGRIVDGRGGTFFSVPKVVAPADAVPFTTLRPERPPVDSGTDYLNPHHEHYSPKLAAAVEAWKAVSADAMLRAHKTVKRALLVWLREHAKEFGLTKEDGRPNEQGIEEVAKIANWATKGGAPKTP